MKQQHSLLALVILITFSPATIAAHSFLYAPHSNYGVNIAVTPQLGQVTTLLGQPRETAGTVTQLKAAQPKHKTVSFLKTAVGRTIMIIGAMAVVWLTIAVPMIPYLRPGIALSNEIRATTKHLTQQLKVDLNALSQAPATISQQTKAQATLKHFQTIALLDFTEFSTLHKYKYNEVINCQEKLAKLVTSFSQFTTFGQQTRSDFLVSLNTKLNGLNLALAATLTAASLLLPRDFQVVAARVRSTLAEFEVNEN